MARLMLIGEVADVQIISPGGPDNDDGQETVLAVCVKHKVGHGIFPRLCGWRETYDTLDDAAEYATGHADRG